MILGQLDRVYNTTYICVHKAAIEGYTGEGSPPHIDMMITAASDKITPPDPAHC